MGTIRAQGVDAASRTTLDHTDKLLDIVLDPACASRLESQTSCSGPPTLDLCALGAKIDTHRIVFIGHSRGGDGVVWAYDRMVSDPADPDFFQPEHYGPGDIKLISSISPVDFENGSPLQNATPNGVPYHLIYGGGDTDVTGDPDHFSSHPFQILERATGPRQSVYVHGAGHGFFHDQCPRTESWLGCRDVSGSHPDCTVTGPPGPTAEQTRTIVKGYYVPLLKRYLEGNVPAKDFLWRSWESFRPIGAPSSARVALEYRDPTAPARLVVDDFQSAPELTLASSGASVDFNLDSTGSGALLEEALRDDDCHFDWSRASLGQKEPIVVPICPIKLCFPPACGCMPGAGPPAACSEEPCDDPPHGGLCDMPCATALAQPMNGMTRAGPNDDAKGVVFGWPTVQGSPPFYYRYSIPAGQSDWSGRTWLTFRASQMPRHPNTLAQTGDLDFTIALSDTSSHTSRIRVGAFLEGPGEPYQRMGPQSACSCAPNGSFCCSPALCDPGFSDPGWQAEFETVRIRLTDFLNNNSHVDLHAIATVAFEFGPNSGSTVGRLALDDVEVIGE